MVRRAINKLHTRKAQDHDGLVAKHFMHASDMIVKKLLACVFKRAMCEGFTKTWNVITIVTILKS